MLSTFPFRRYIICWGNLSLSKIIGGKGHPALPHPFILQNCVYYTVNKLDGVDSNSNGFYYCIRKKEGGTPRSSAAFM